MESSTMQDEIVQYPVLGMTAEEDEVYRRAEVEVVRRWLRRSPLKLENQQDEEHFPHLVRWVDHVQEFIDDGRISFHAPEKSHGMDAGGEDQCACSRWRRLSLARKGAARLLGAPEEGERGHKTTERAFLMACVCQHPPGRLPPNGGAAKAPPDSKTWAEAVAAAMQLQLEGVCGGMVAQHAARRHSVFRHEKTIEVVHEQEHHSRTHIVATTQKLKELAASIDVEGVLTAPVELPDGILLPSDKLLLKGPMASGRRYSELQKLSPPVKLTFLLTEPPEVEMKRVLAAGDGPYTEVHRQFCCFDNEVVQTSEFFLGLLYIQSSLAELHVQSLCQGYARSEYLSCPPRATGDLSARRAPQQALKRGAR